MFHPFLGIRIDIAFLKISETFVRLGD